MLLVIDTNIIVSAIKVPRKYDDKGNLILTKPQRLMRDVFNGVHQMVISQAIIDEYTVVLHRDYLKLNQVLVERFLSAIKLYSLWIEPLPTTEEEIQMGDEKDRIFFDVAKCLNIKLVTGNLKHYPVHELRTSLNELY